MCVWKWQPNRRTASWSYARLCDIDTHINSLENISHTQWDSWFLLISSNIATIPCQIPEHTTAFVGFHVFPCLPQRGRVAPSERSRLPLRGLVLSTRGVITRIDAFAQGQLLCISANGLQPGHLDAPHFGWPKITFDRISHHFRSMRNLNFFLRKSLLIAFYKNNSQNDCRSIKMAAFWMTENHFRSHFSAFQKSDLGYFGWPKITFDRFRSIRNFCFRKMAISNFFFS